MARNILHRLWLVLHRCAFACVYGPQNGTAPKILGIDWSGSPSVGVCVEYHGDVVLRKRECPCCGSVGVARVEEADQK